LGLRDLTTFLSDTFHRDAAYIEPLAGLIKKKTDGNPFFVIQFLKSLEQEGLLEFDADHAGWSFGMDAIAAAGMTDNVVDLMTRKILRLSANGQRLIMLAACIGNQFDWKTFRTVVGPQSGDDAEAGLAEVLDAGLIQPVGETVYSFLHDRVQQAAYGLIPEVERPPLHLQVGRLLFAEHGADAADDRIFTIVNHINLGSALIADHGERVTLARLNLAAGRKAKMSAAYQAALEYFEAGIALL